MIRVRCHCGGGYSQARPGHRCRVAARALGAGQPAEPVLPGFRTGGGRARPPSPVSKNSLPWSRSATTSTSESPDFQLRGSVSRTALREPAAASTASFVSCLYRSAGVDRRMRTRAVDDYGRRQSAVWRWGADHGETLVMLTIRSARPAACQAESPCTNCALRSGLRSFRSTCHLHLQTARFGA